MGELIEAIVLGIVQGVTEFLPVSSSGHLEIVKFLLGDDDLGEQSMMMTVVLHFATAIATVIALWHDVKRILRDNILHVDFRSNYLSLVLISMIPAVFVGLALEDQIESLFSQNLLLVGLCLAITGILLLISDRKYKLDVRLSLSIALIIGVAQAIAILPGISRSGATIATALLLGVARKEAAQFSFIIVIPLIFGKMAKDILGGDFSIGNMDHLALIAGFIAALVTGIIACKLMIRIVQSAKLSWFAFYCFAVAFCLLMYQVVL